jgi:hypothetical protein
MVFIVFLFNFITSNFLVWWGGFLLITLVFVFLNKNLYCYSSLLNYFIIQEVLGLLFLFLSFSLLQFFIVIIKVGVSPVHFWIFNITNNLYRVGVLWFLTFQKLPFFPVLLYLLNLYFFCFLLVGVVYCYFQLLIIKNYKNLVIISSTESFNWVLLVGFLSFLRAYFLFFYYFFLIFIFLPYFLNLDYNFLNWEVVLVFLNIPFTFTFFIKLFSLRFVLRVRSFIFLFILLIIFLRILRFSFFLVNLRTININNSQNVYKSSFFFTIPLIILVLIYYFSKIYYIILIRWSSFGSNKTINRFSMFGYGPKRYFVFFFCSLV